MGTLQGPVLCGILTFLLLPSSFGLRPTCEFSCGGSGENTLKYVPGTSYVYKLEGTTETKLAGSTDTVGKLGLSATADLLAQPNCGFILKVSDVQLSGPDGKTYPGGEEFIGHEVQFGMTNGQLNSELCYDKSHSQNSLNIKRAIISLLQSSAFKESGTSTHETDIFGVCPTRFSVSHSGETINVKKFKNLNKCSHREEFEAPFLTTPYYGHTNFESSPLMDASSNVQQDIEHGIVKSVSSEEIYIYNPAQQSESGVKVSVHNKLSLASQNKGKTTPETKMPNHSPIIFDVPHQVTGTNNAKDIMKALQKACESVDPHVKENGARSFKSLVNSLSHASKDTILSTYSQVKSGAAVKDVETAKKILLDAIIRADSGESVEAMAALLKQNEITGLRAKIWLLSLGSIKHATRASLKSVMPLLDGEPTTEAYLGIGMLAGKFCRDHNCAGVQEVDDLEVKLAAPLSAGCKPSTHDAEDHLIASLKGLGNIHYLSHQIVHKLSQCAADKSARTRVRVAALETIQSDPKKAEFKSTCQTLLSDVQEDAEIRIKAYLCIVRCPCEKTAAFLKGILQNEPVYQVGSFIVSHLKNLQASTNPELADSQHYFKEIKTDKKFPFDFRKYSMNHETSYNIDAINIGATAESNVIFSQKSYLPRSLSLNLTTQLFGHSFNWLELDARVENLDYIIEKWFGPRGYFRTKDGNEVLSVSRETFGSLLEKVAERYEKTMRPKRSTTRAQLEAIEKRVNLNNEITDHSLDLDLSMKVYGSEIGWFNYHSSDPEYHVETLLDLIFGHLQSTVDNVRNIQTDYKKNLVFLDMEMAYPTGMGLPLKLDVTGTSALRLKIDGKFDLPAIIKNPNDADVKLQVIPSVAVELAGTISVDGSLIESGVKLSLNIHSATGSDLTLRVLDGHGVDIQFGLPVENQEIISVKTDALSIVREKDLEQVNSPVKFNTKRKEYEGCFDQLSFITGLTFCGEMKMPWEGQKILLPSFGPSKFSLSIVKSEPKLTGYHCKIYFKKDKESGVFELLLDTPETEANRKLNLIVDYEIGKFLKIHGISPFYTAKFDGTMNMSPKEATINMKFNNNGEEFVLKLGSLIEKTSTDVSKYQPIFEYKAPESAGKLIGRKGSTGGKQSYYVSGTVEVESKGGKPSTFTINDLTLHTPRSAYTVTGKAHNEDHAFNCDLKVKYGENQVIIKGDVSEKGDENNQISKFNLEILPSQYPDMGFSVNWDYSHKKNNNEIENFKSNLIIVHGPNPQSMDARVTLYNYFERKQDQIKSNNHATYPILGIEAKANLEVLPNGGSYDVKVKFEDYFAESSFDGKINVNNEDDYNIDFKGAIMNNNVHLVAKRDILEEGKSKFSNKFEFLPGGTYKHNAIVIHKLEDDDINFHVDSELLLPSSTKPLKLITGIKHNSKECGAELKVLSDSNVFIDAKITHKIPSHTGDFKVLLPNYLDSHGKYSYINNNFKGNGELDLPKASRKMNSNIDLKIEMPKISGFLDICWDTSNPEKTIKIETNSHFDEESFETKNTLHFQKYKTELNGKGKMTGSLTDGTVSGEAEVILPDSRHLVGKISRSMHATDGHIDGELILDIMDHEKKGASPRKVTLKVVGKNIDLEKGLFDGQGSLIFTKAADNKDLHLNANLKRTHSGKSKWNVNAEVSATGSLLEHPINLKLTSEADENILKGTTLNEPFPPYKFKLSCSCSPTTNIVYSGESKDNSHSSELIVELPKKYDIHNLKWSMKNYINLIPHKESVRKINTHNSLSWNDGKFLKLDGEISEEDHGANFKLDWESNDFSKRSLNGAAHYKMGHGSEPCEGDFNVHMTRDGANSDLTIKVLVPHNGEQSSLHVVGNAPNTGKFDVLLKNKILENAKGFHFDSNILIDEDKIMSSAKVEVHDGVLLVDAVSDRSAGKSKFYFKGEAKEERHYATELKLKWTQNGGGSLIHETEINLHSLEDFMVKARLDSPQLKLNKYELDIDGKSNIGKSPGNKLMLSLKNAEEVIFSGSATYNIHDKGEMKIMEGTGNIKIRGEAYPLNFNLKSEPFEEGKKITLDAKAGKHSLDVVCKKTPNEISLHRQLCIDQKCSEAQVLVKREGTGIHDMQSTFIFKGDFSLLKDGYKDIMLKASAKKNNLLHDSVIEFHWGSDKKIAYNEFIHEHQAGFSLEFPERTIAGELKYDYPKGKDQRLLTVEGSLWLNKVKSPEKKTHFLLNGKRSMSKDSFVLSGDMTFSHPGLSKELSTKGKLVVNNGWEKPIVDAHAEIDIFKDPSQKINLDAKVKRSKEKGGFGGISVFNIKSNGCHLDHGFEIKALITKTHVLYVEKLNYLDLAGSKKEIISKIEMTPQKFHITSKTPSHTIVDATYKLDSKSGNYHITGSMDLCGSKLKQTLTYSPPFHVKGQFIHSKAVGEKAVDINLGVGKDKAEMSINFDKANIIDAQIDLTNENFLKPKYTFDLENVKKLYKTTTEDVISNGKHCESVMESFYENTQKEMDFICENIKNALIDGSPVLESFRKELEEIKKEIESDDTINSTIQALKKAIGDFIEHVVVIMEELKEILYPITILLREGTEKFTTILKELSPEVKNLVEKIGHNFVNILEECLNLAIQIADLCLDQLKLIEEDLKILLDPLSSYIHDLSNSFASVVEEVKGNLKEFWNAAIQQLKELPIKETIEEKWNELKEIGMPEEIIVLYDEFVNQVKNILPTEELSQLFTTLSSFLHKLMKREDVDIPETLNQIYSDLVAAIKSVASLITSSRDYELPTIFMSLPSFWKIPSGSMKVSLINWLLSNDHPNIEEIILNYLNPSLNPLDHIPPFKSKGTLIGGTELITFDGQHFSLKGTCSYILAEDYVDGNFSIVANVANGKLKSITMFDEHDSVEIRHNQNAIVNGKSSEYPVYAGHLKAWRRPHLFGVWNDAGVLVICESDCSSCQVKLSGFYFNKVRGLLGNPNYEPYDDLMVPEGKVANSAVEFGNAWKVDSSCADISVPGAHSHQRESLCSKMFTEEDELELCYYTIDPKPYRDACDHLVQVATTPDAKKAAACGVATSYAATCRDQGHVLVEVPDTCITCNIENEKIPYGKSIKVETPGKSADVLFVVEQLKNNEELFKAMVPNLVTSLTNEFKDKGISDVHFGLVGFGNPKNWWHNYFTTDGEILFNGKTDNIEFYDEPTRRNDTVVDKIKLLQDDFNVEIGNTARSRVYWDIGKSFKFRPKSVKTVFAIHAKPCEHGKLVLSLGLIKSAVGFGLFKYSGINVNYVVPGTFGYEGVHKSIVGYSGDHLYTLDDIKQKPIKGITFDEDELDEAYDLCAAFTSGLDGNVFSGGNFLKEKPGARKQFVNIMARRVVDSLTEEQEHYSCECSKVHGLFPHFQCEMEDPHEEAVEALTDAVKTKKGQKS